MTHCECCTLSLSHAVLIVVIVWVWMECLFNNIKSLRGRNRSFRDKYRGFRSRYRNLRTWWILLTCFSLYSWLYLLSSIYCMSYSHLFFYLYHVHIFFSLVLSQLIFIRIRTHWLSSFHIIHKLIRYWLYDVLEKHLLVRNISAQSTIYR